MANICPKCNEENNDDAIFCQKCSYRLVGVYGQPKQEYTNDAEEPQKSENYMILCPCCKKQISSKAVSCPQCGHPINNETVQNCVQKVEKKHSIFELRCPKCKEYNISVNVETVTEYYGGRTELRKKSAITNTANSFGRVGMILATGGLWALTPKKSKYNEIQKGKTKKRQIKTAICQNCGYSWNI